MFFLNILIFASRIRPSAHSPKTFGLGVQILRPKPVHFKTKTRYETSESETCKSASRDAFGNRDQVSITDRPVTRLGHQGVQEFSESGPSLITICPILSNYVQCIFPMGRKIFYGELGTPWLQVWLSMVTLSYWRKKESFSRILSLSNSSRAVTSWYFWGGQNDVTYCCTWQIHVF